MKKPKAKKRTKRMWAAINPQILHDTRRLAKATAEHGDLIIRIEVPNAKR